MTGKQWGDKFMKLSELIKGNIVTFQIPLTNRVQDFESRVLGIKDGVIIFSEIRYGERKIRMPEDGIVNVIFQVFNRLYIWKHVIIENLIVNGRIYYRIKNSDVESSDYNRRGAFRLNVNEFLPVDIYTGGLLEKHNCLVCDVSESGLRFELNKDLHYKTRIHLMYKDSFEMNAYIVRKVFDSKKNTFVYGCRMDIYNSALGRFIMKEQIRRRKVTA